MSVGPIGRGDEPVLWFDAPVGAPIEPFGFTAAHAFSVIIYHVTWPARNGDATIAGFPVTVPAHERTNPRTPGANHIECVAGGDGRVDIRAGIFVESC